ncbi:MAG: nucleotide exchange factor GrpE [FCB group bacterium]|jgi:molecular chaperone GrpE|nr:nucleotide exchange factor GrpE [FCB group bacterium]
MKQQPKKTELEKKLKAEMAAEKSAAPSEDEPQRREMNAEELNPAEEVIDGAPESLDTDEELPEMVPAHDFQTLIQEHNELKNQLLRARAEFDNYRKRTQREAEQTRQRATEALIRDLLPVIDNLDLALQHADKEHPISEGVSMVARQFQDVLRRAGVEIIPAVGSAFDPEIHEAVMHAPSEEVAENTVSHEFQKGYRLGGFVLRPSKVAVSKGAPEAPAADEASE